MRLIKWMPAIAVVFTLVLIYVPDECYATFGIAITDGAGVTLAALTPAQTSAVAFGLAALAGAGLLLGVLFAALQDEGGNGGGGGGGGGGGDVVVVDGYGAPSYGGGYGGGGGGGGGSGYGAPAASYGAPATGYGAPSTGYGGGSGGGGHGSGGSTGYGGGGGGGGSGYGGGSSGGSNSYGAPAAPAYGSTQSQYGKRRGEAAEEGSVLDAVGAKLRSALNRNKRSTMEDAQMIAFRAEEMFNIMSKTDPADCYRRLICDLAAKQGKGLETSAPIMNLLAVDHAKIDAYLTPVSKNMRYELKMAQRFGAKVKSVDACERVFSCPFSGGQMNKLLMSVHEQQMAANVNVDPENDI